MIKTPSVLVATGEEGAARSLVARVRSLNGHLVVYIPLAEGGRELTRVTRGLSDIEGNNLKIVLPGWLAQELFLKEGCEISINNRHGQLHIQLLGHCPQPGV